MRLARPLANSAEYLLASSRGQKNKTSQLAVTENIETARVTRGRAICCVTGRHELLQGEINNFHGIELKKMDDFLLCGNGKREERAPPERAWRCTPSARYLYQHSLAASTILSFVPLFMYRRLVEQQEFVLIERKKKIRC
jgi:hypothetical protein